MAVAARKDDSRNSKKKVKIDSTLDPSTGGLPSVKESELAWFIVALGAIGTRVDGA